MFSKKPEQKSAPRARTVTSPMSKNSSTFSVIGSDVRIVGDVSASTELHVDGAIEGDIACSSLVQGETSVIKGAIKAESARIAGTLTGSIAARELVVLKSAKIDGDVQYDALTIEQGAKVEGRFAPQSSQKAPAAEKQTPMTKALNEDEPKLIISN